ncbi:MAG: 5'/3'-nucleotidase SurE [Bacteroidales bacterium]|nr:5'/3'-nucleotidase SurE [Bacteroidales bacterium]
MEISKPLILVTNDDGIMSKGLSALIKFIRPLGEIVVMAPDSARSGSSGAITSCEPIHYTQVRQDVGLSVYKCSGTPVDCIKVALNKVCSHKPDLVLAGINHGDNSATNVYNSGTMGAVIEGCLDGIKSIAFSLCDHEMNADFEPQAIIVRQITTWALQHELPELTCLNVNFPKLLDYKGLKVCKMARGYWTRELDPCPRRGDDHYFWLGGEYIELNVDDGESDRRALAEGYVAITPTKLDVTDYQYMDKLQREMDLLS